MVHYQTKRIPIGIPRLICQSVRKCSNLLGTVNLSVFSPPFVVLKAEHCAARNNCNSMTPFSFIDCSDEGNAKTLFIVRLAYRLPQYCSSQPRQTNTQNVIKFYQLLIPIFLHDLPHTPHSRLHQYRRKKHERVQHLDEKKPYQESSHISSISLCNTNQPTNTQTLVQNRLPFFCIISKKNGKDMRIRCPHVCLEDVYTSFIHIMYISYEYYIGGERYDIDWLRQSLEDLLALVKR